MQNGTTASSGCKMRETPCTSGEERLRGSGSETKNNSTASIPVNAPATIHWRLILLVSLARCCWDCVNGEETVKRHEVSRDEQDLIRTELSEFSFGCKSVTECMLTETAALEANGVMNGFHQPIAPVRRSQDTH